VAEKASLAAVGIDDPEQDAQAGGLAGTVRSEDSVDRAGRDLQVYVAERGFAIEGLGEALGLDGYARLHFYLPLCSLELVGGGRVRWQVKAA